MLFLSYVLPHTRHTRKAAKSVSMSSSVPVKRLGDLNNNRVLPDCLLKSLVV